jgi:aspartyl aminopeptidase
MSGRKPGVGRKKFRAFLFLSYGIKNKIEDRMEKEIKFAEELIDFIHSSPSEFHVVKNSETMFKENGFQKLEHGDDWKIEKGGRYYTTTNGSAFIAFIAGTGELCNEGFKIIEAHTDSPTIKIKPKPEMKVDNHYLKLNAEVYGSPILNTWLDRPLTLAGRVSLKSDDVMNPKDVLVSFNRPLLYIPNLSIHHNKGVNSGLELNPQKDMLPLLGLIDENLTTDNLIYRLLAEKLKVDPSDILDFELSMSEYDRGCITGLNNEFISSTKLDNLCLVHAGINALVSREAGRATSMLCCFDNEEVGNRTRQAADSPMLINVMERVAVALGDNRSGFFRGLSKSFMISADMSHALHPNAPEKSDPVVKVKINKGSVIKVSGGQKFTTDSNSSAVYRMLCEKAGVPCQYYINRSDSPGGSSAGPASITQVDMRSVDIGVAVFAMHSIREMCGTNDNYNVFKTFEEFFK